MALTTALSCLGQWSLPYKSVFSSVKWGCLFISLYRFIVRLKWNWNSFVDLDVLCRCKMVLQLLCSVAKIGFQSSCTDLMFRRGSCAWNLMLCDHCLEILNNCIFQIALCKWCQMGWRSVWRSGASTVLPFATSLFSGTNSQLLTLWPLFRDCCYPPLLAGTWL